MIKSSHVKSALALAVAFAGAYTLFAPTDANAEMVSALSCNVEHSDWVSDYVVNASGIYNQSGNRMRAIHCPLPNSFRTASHTLFVDGYDGSNDVNGQVIARICMAPYWGAAPDCGAFSRMTVNTESTWFYGRQLDWYDTGAGNMTRLHNVNGYAGYYADLIIGMPAPGVGGASQIYGFSGQ